MTAGLTQLIAVVGRSPVPVWPFLQCAAMVGAGAWFWRRSRAPELRRLRAPLVAGFVGAGVGARVLTTALELPSRVHAGHGLHALTEGGQMAYGALLGLVLVYLLVARRRGFTTGASLDVLAPTVGILVGLARLGCLFGGCDFGRVTSRFAGVRYPAGSPAFQQHLAASLVLASDRTSLAVHPTQLYEALLGALMAGAALMAERRARRDGGGFAAASATYAAGRFGIELLRGDDSRGFLWSLSTSQWLSVGVLAAVVAWALCETQSGVIARS
ncbi:MAG: prolipoprotein diacylglyceryl transferase [Myxococcales bacterium]|nr:prolipoprotein diacylglyceryl transferase [Myxococcales bacterium]MBL0195931.1 prolipoprotein diacylglyceryl transferase [Myxococcales bacterium]HQY62323.1 prolipoprotein diacylglyceryl transferase [Polyangiaceae bacterium]